MSAAEALARVMAMPGAPWAAMGNAGAGLLLVSSRTNRMNAIEGRLAARNPSTFPLDPTDPAVETVLRRAVGGHAQVVYGDDGACGIEWWPTTESDDMSAIVRAPSPIEAWCALVERLGGWPTAGAP